jgi:acetate kinase
MANVLALNSGSSSLKFGLYLTGSSPPEILLSGEAQAIGAATGKFYSHNSSGHAVMSETVAFSSQQDAMLHIGKALKAANMPEPHAIGHRIVHGGPALRTHRRVDEAVLQQLEAATRFAPLHVPAALSVIRVTQEQFPGAPQVACFDTTFHAGMPDVARILSIPRELQSEGIQRYGFHGLSCESILGQLAGDLPARVVIAHLGNGASVTAVKRGKSIDTSMGLTPTGGLIMGTRSGDLDPGVLVYLMREKQFDATKLEELVDHHSGLLGVSCVDSDMRRLRTAAPGNPDAQLAIEMFGYSVRKHIAGMIAALGGIDLLVFTGGIGENDWETRLAICGGMAWTGIELDAQRNQENTNPVSAAHSACRVLVLNSREERQIAHHTWTVLSQHNGD